MLATKSAIHNKHLATGGTVTSYTTGGNTYRAHTFLSSGTFQGFTKSQWGHWVSVKFNDISVFRGHAPKPSVGNGLLVIVDGGASSKSQRIVIFVTFTELSPGLVRRRQFSGTFQDFTKS